MTDSLKRYYQGASADELDRVLAELDAEFKSASVVNQGRCDGLVSCPGWFSSIGEFLSDIRAEHC